MRCRMDVDRYRLYYGIPVRDIDVSQTWFMVMRQGVIERGQLLMVCYVIRAIV